MCLSSLQQRYSKSLSWTLNFPPITVNNLFKIQTQDSDLEIWKTYLTFWKKIPLIKVLYGISLYAAVDFGLGIQIYSSTQQQCCPRFHCWPINHKPETLNIWPTIQGLFTIYLIWHYWPILPFIFRYGRRTSFFMLLFMEVTVSIITCFAPNYTVFTVLRTLNGVTFPALFQIPFILCKF